MEVWKDILDFEDYYQISNYGRVKSLRRYIEIGKHSYWKNEIIMKQQLNLKTGYRAVSLCKNSKYKLRTIHRVMAIAFIPNPENKPEVNHLDGVKTNNYVGNLEWNTSSENIQHAFDTGLFNTEAFRNRKTRWNHD